MTAPQISTTASGAALQASLLPGELIDGTWRVIGKLGEGTFSEIFASVDVKTGCLAALKTERHGTKPVLNWEANLLGRLQRYPWVPRKLGFVPAPTEASNRGLQSRILVMQLLGPNISQLRKEQPFGRFRFRTICHIGLQLLTCIECLHREGFVHRDIKPSNCVIGKGPVASRVIHLLDYGLSRMYCNAEGVVRPARRVVEFRGTSVYASINAHTHKDLGRRDDLWSLFYVLMDMLHGSLPWRAHQGQIDFRDQCARAKEYYIKKPQELIGKAPGRKYFLKFHEHVKSLAFAATPDYQLLANCLTAAAAEYGAEVDVYRRYPPSRQKCNVFKFGSSVITNALGAEGEANSLNANDSLYSNAITPVASVVTRNLVTEPEISALRPIPVSFFDLRKPCGSVCNCTLVEPYLQQIWNTCPFIFTSDSLLFSRGGNWIHDEQHTGLELGRTNRHGESSLIVAERASRLDHLRQTLGKSKTNSQLTETANSKYDGDDETGQNVPKAEQLSVNKDGEGNHTNSDTSKPQSISVHHEAIKTALRDSWNTVLDSIFNSKDVSSSLPQTSQSEQITSSFAKDDSRSVGTSAINHDSLKNLYHSFVHLSSMDAVDSEGTGNNATATAPAEPPGAVAVTAVEGSDDQAQVLVDPDASISEEKSHGIEHDSSACNIPPVTTKEQNNNTEAPNALQIPPANTSIFTRPLPQTLPQLLSHCEQLSRLDYFGGTSTCSMRQKEFQPGVERALRRLVGVTAIANALTAEYFVKDTVPHSAIRAHQFLRMMLADTIRGLAVCHADYEGTIELAQHSDRSMFMSAISRSLGEVCLWLGANASKPPPMDIKDMSLESMQVERETEAKGLSKAPNTNIRNSSSVASRRYPDLIPGSPRYQDLHEFADKDGKVKKKRLWGLGWQERTQSNLPIPRRFVSVLIEQLLYNPAKMSPQALQLWTTLRGIGDAPRIHKSGASLEFPSYVDFLDSLREDDAQEGHALQELGDMFSTVTLFGSHIIPQLENEYTSRSPGHVRNIPKTDSPISRTKPVETVDHVPVPVASEPKHDPPPPLPVMQPSAAPSLVADQKNIRNVSTRTGSLPNAMGVGMVSTAISMASQPTAQGTGGTPVITPNRQHFSGIGSMAQPLYPGHRISGSMSGRWPSPGPAHSYNQMYRPPSMIPNGSAHSNRHSWSYGPNAPNPAPMPPPLPPPPPPPMDAPPPPPPRAIKRPRYADDVMQTSP